MNPLKPIRQGIFTPQMIFLFILFSLLFVFLFANTNVILSRLGFETTTTLKSQLTASQGNLEKLVLTNQSNAKALKLERAQNLVLTQQLKALGEAKEKAKEQVTVINAKKVGKAAPLMAAVVQKEVVTEHTVTLPRQEIDALSEANIDQLHEVFDTLFPKG